MYEPVNLLRSEIKKTVSDSRYRPAGSHGVKQTAVPVNRYPERPVQGIFTEDRYVSGFHQSSVAVVYFLNAGYEWMEENTVISMRQCAGDLTEEFPETSKD